ncbi:hypothetical protein Q6280_27420, partial [Klebsiella pneumoniae]
VGAAERYSPEQTCTARIVVDDRARTAAVFGTALEIVKSTLVEVGGESDAVVLDRDGEFDIRGHCDGDVVCVCVPKDVAQSLSQYSLGVL